MRFKGEEDRGETITRLKGVLATHKHVYSLGGVKWVNFTDRDVPWSGDSGGSNRCSGGTLAAAPNVFPCSWNPNEGPGGWREKLTGGVCLLPGAGLDPSDDCFQ